MNLLHRYLAKTFSQVHISATHQFMNPRRLLIFIGGKIDDSKKMEIETHVLDKLSGVQVKCVDTVFSTTWGVENINDLHLTKDQKKEFRQARDNFSKVLLSLGIDFATEENWFD